jgi:hypothetical protein
MSTGVLSEPTGEAVQGTDQAAHSVSKPAVEVTFAVSKAGADGPLSDAARAGRIAAGIAKMQAAGAATGKAATPAAKPAAPAKPASSIATSSPTTSPAASPALEVAKVEEAQPADAEAVAAAAEGEESASIEGEESATLDAAAEPAAEGAEGEQPPADPPAEEEAKPDAVEAATLKAEIAARENELALARAQLDRYQSGAVSDDERAGWIERPIDTLRSHVARMLGVKPDAPEVTEELAHLQRELTLEAVGVSNLPDERKQQRTVERYDRAERLKQTVRQASQATTQAAQQRTQVVGFVASTLEAAKDEFPYAGLASEMDGRKPEEAALDLWMAAVKDGRVKIGESDAANVREALRLTNDHYKARLEKLNARQPKTTAPPPATAPAPASPTGAAPGARDQTQSRAPAKKPASDPPKTLSAKQAAASPVVKVTPSQKPNEGPAQIDPNDKDGRLKRIIEAGRRHLTK